MRAAKVHVREEHFAEHVVQADELDAGGQVGVDAVLAEELMVLYVVSLRNVTPPFIRRSLLGRGAYLECSRVRDPDGQVREHCERLVRSDTSECQVVRDLVDGEEQVLVRGGANDVGEAPEGPGEEGRRSEHVGTQDLDTDDEEHDILG